MGVLHDIASDKDLLASVSDLTKLMGTAGQLGMLTGVTDAQGFKRQFSGMVKQVKEIAQFMGTSIEEASPLFALLA